VFFPNLPAAEWPDRAGHGDMGERGQQFLPPVPGTVLQSDREVCQREIFLHRHRCRAGGAGTRGLLRGPEGEQVPAADGK